MKKVIKWMAFIPTWIVSFTIVTILDAAFFVIGLLTKAVRWTMTRLFAVIDLDGDGYETARNELTKQANDWIRNAYTFYIDKMYPTDYSFDYDEEEDEDL